MDLRLFVFLLLVLERQEVQGKKRSKGEISDLNYHDKFYVSSWLECQKWCDAMPCCRTGIYFADGACRIVCPWHTLGHSTPWCSPAIAEEMARARPGDLWLSGKREAPNCGFRKTTPTAPRQCARSNRRIKICMNTNHINERGTERANFDYGYYLKHVLGHEVVWLVADWGYNGTCCPEVRSRFEREFGPFRRYPVAYEQYAGPGLADLVHRERCHLLYTQKADTVHDPPAAAEHALRVPFASLGIFGMNDLHGTSRAAISVAIAQRATHCPMSPAVPYPVVVSYGNATADIGPAGESLRRELGVGPQDLLLCRHGAKDTFDIPFVRSTIPRLVAQYPSLHLLFVNTDHVMSHARVHHRARVVEQAARDRYFAACDGMLHGRNGGETFGMAVAEMSRHNRPIVTCTSCGDQAHTAILGAKGLHYNSPGSLLQAVGVLVGMGRAEIHRRDWDMYRGFSGEAVVRVFDELFIQPALAYWQEVEDLGIADPWTAPIDALPPRWQYWLRSRDGGGAMRPCAFYRSDEGLETPARTARELRAALARRRGDGGGRGPPAVAPGRVRRRRGGGDGPDRSNHSDWHMLMQYLTTGEALKSRAPKAF